MLDKEDIKEGVKELKKILDLANIDQADAEFEYKKFMKDYSIEEQEMILDELLISNGKHYKNKVRLVQ